MVLVPLPHLTTLTIHLNSSPMGYNTCAYLDRIAHTSDQFSEEENNQEIERAIDEIIRYDFMNIYKKVKRTKTTKADKA